MRAFLYSLQIAVKNLYQEKWINMLTTLTIAVCLLILSTFTLITLNMDMALTRWAKGFGLVVYLKDNLSPGEESILKEFFKKDSDITEINYISKDEALKGLRQALGDMNPILEGFEENPLPSSFELKLKREALQPSHIKEKSLLIKQLPGVEDVQYGEKWLSSLNSLIKGLKIIAMILGSIISVAIAFVTYSTIKILFYRRSEEVATLKLLGASRSFIRLPFLIEGLFIGIFGGIIGSLTLTGLYVFTTLRVVEFLPSIKGITTFFPPLVYPLLPIAGGMMSLIGSIFATGRIRY